MTTVIVVATIIGCFAVAMGGLLVGAVRSESEWRSFRRDHYRAVQKYEAEMAEWERSVRATPPGQRIPSFPGRPPIMCGSWARRLRGSA